MTDIFAAYLFLCGAVILLVIGIWSKMLWIFYTSAAGWICAGIFCIVNAQGAIFVDMLGIFCLFAGIGAITAGIMLSRKTIEPPEPYDRVKDIDDTLEYYRKMRQRRVR